MEYTTLNNGIKMPMAGIGTFLLSPDEAENSVLSALKEGYRLIDTANAYMNEKAVGRAIKKSGVPREDIFLETKLWPSFYENEDAVEKLWKDWIQIILTCYCPPAGRKLYCRLSPDGKSIQRGKCKSHRTVKLYKRRCPGNFRYL